MSNNMDWLIERLQSGARGTKAAFARRLNWTPEKVSKLLAGERKLSDQELAMALDFFGLEAGFGESRAEPFEPHPATIPAFTLDRARLTLRQPTLYRLTADVPDLLLSAGDLLICELKHDARAGDLVIATIAPSYAEPFTSAFRFVPPMLIDRIRTMRGYDVTSNDPSAAVMATVEGVLRGLAAAD